MWVLIAPSGTIHSILAADVVIAHAIVVVIVVVIVAVIAVVVVVGMAVGMGIIVTMMNVRREGVFVVWDRPSQSSSRG